MESRQSLQKNMRFTFTMARDEEAGGFRGIRDDNWYRASSSIIRPSTLALRAAQASGSEPAAAAQDRHLYPVKCSILVVEDSPGIRAFMRQALAASGYDVYEAGSAFEARKILRSYAVDAITLDLGLPDEDGLEFLRDTHEKDKDHPPVIVCSVRNDRGTRETAHKYGAEAYLAKPFDIHDLLSSVGRLVDGQPHRPH